MTWSETAQILAASALLITALGTVWNGVQLKTNAKAVEQIHIATNSMKDELVSEVRKASRAQGLLEGRAEERL